MFGMYGTCFQLHLSSVEGDFVWYNEAMTEKRAQILKIFSYIVINANCLSLSLSSNEAENMNLNGGQTSKIFRSEASKHLKKPLKH